MVSLTYAAFLALFLVPPLLALGTIASRSRAVRNEIHPPVVALLVALAVVYTTPWDNYLIARSVWGYGPGTVAATVWRAPVEEYLFIVLQVLLVSLWVALLAARSERPSETGRVSRRARVGGLLAAATVGGGGVAALGGESTFYLGAILVWAAPVLAIQWVVGWPALLARWRTVTVGVAGPTVYFSAIDAVAISQGIWTIAPATATGLSLGPLPVEEAVFFLCTSLFVVQALVLYPWVVRRWQ
jgi:lycopene cyclase domain-containing protein